MGKKIMDAKLFRAIKIMTEGGATADEIADYFHVSRATVSRVRAADSLEEYHAMMAAMHVKAKERKPAPPKEEPKPVVAPAPPVQREPLNPTVVRVEATHYMMEELRKLNESTELISRKMTAALETLTKILESWN